MSMSRIINDLGRPEMLTDIAAKYIAANPTEAVRYLTDQDDANDAIRLVNTIAIDWYKTVEAA